MPSVIFHPEYRKYSFGKEHPFSPLRVELMFDLLRSAGEEVRPIEPPPATHDDVADVHADYYIRRVRALSAGEAVEDAEEYGLGTPDTPAFCGMHDAALWHVGGTLYGARLIQRGEKRVLQLGGGMHHARRNFAAGFCVYNDLAVAINSLTRHGLWVVYLDLDVHHGDGVQQILYDDPRVMTISVHESGQYLFPGTGAVHELGDGRARGLKLNLPLEPFTEGASYLEVLESVIPPALEHFRPAVLVVQAGADAHFDDPLADLMLTTQDYEVIYRRVLEWADAFTAGRVLFTLGGGYSVRAVPRIWAMLYLMVHGLPIPASLHDPASPRAVIDNREEIAHRNRETAHRLLASTRQYWF